MDQINSFQLKFDNRKTKSLDNNFKQHLKYLIELDKKACKMNKQMVNVLSNLNIIMCHVFIKVQSLMPQKINIFDSNYDEQTMVNNQKIVEK
jgi:hypothetical protein